VRKGRQKKDREIVEGGVGEIDREFRQQIDLEIRKGFGSIRQSLALRSISSDDRLDSARARERQSEEETERGEMN
jgi:hypothetical protein